MPRPPGAFTYANELAAFIRSRCGFCLGGACYPETHQLAPSPEADLRQPGAQGERGRRVPDHAALFDNADYFAFVARARAAGIRRADRAGHHADHQRRQHPAHRRAVARRASPRRSRTQLRRVEHDDALTLEVGVEWATRQCRELLDARRAGHPLLHHEQEPRDPTRVRDTFARDERPRARLAAAPRGAALRLGHQPRRT